MDYEKKKLLYTDNSEIITIDGKYLCSLAMTDRAIELVNNADWDKTNESWLSYRNRTEQERINENLKRQELTKDLVIAYNEKFGFQNVKLAKTEINK